MSTDHDRTQKNRPMTENPKPTTASEGPAKAPTQDLLARVGEAFEADAATVQRITMRARAAAQQKIDLAPSASFRWVFGTAVASALALLVAVSVWRLPATDNPLPVFPLDEPAQTEPAQEEPTTLVISNKSGFVTVQAGGSQWIVLPGDVS